MKNNGHQSGFRVRHAEAGVSGDSVHTCSVQLVCHMCSRCDRGSAWGLSEIIHVQRLSQEDTGARWALNRNVAFVVTVSRAVTDGRCALVAGPEVQLQDSW